MLEDCRFYIVKSSNEDNIQKARDCSVWATTFTNQVLLTPIRINSRLLFTALNTSSSSLPPIAAMNSKDSPEWKASLIRYLINLSGVE